MPLVFLNPYQAQAAGGLPSVEELKLYLRIKHTAEDVMIEQLRASAVGMIEHFLGRALESGSISWLGRSSGYRVVTSLRYASEDGAVTVGAHESGRALIEEDGYHTSIEPVLQQAIRDVVADLYARRVTTIASESSAGLSVSYTGEGLSARVRAMLAPFRWN